MLHKCSTLYSQISAEQIHAWIARHLPDRPHPPVKRPVNWLKWTVIIVTVLTTVGIIAKAWHLILPVIQSRFLWAVGTLFLILAFTSGYMFNSIRKTPYVAGNPQGGISYFAPGFQNQLGIETQIIGFLCKHLSVLRSRQGGVYALTSYTRWSSGRGHYFSHYQGSQRARSQETAGYDHSLGWRIVPYVQLPTIRVPFQERWLSFQVATVLLDLWIYRERRRDAS